MTLDTSQGVQNQAPVAPATPRMSRRDRRRQNLNATPRHLRANRTAYLMIAPMVVLLAIFVIWPLIYSIYLSLFDVNFYKGNSWVGLQFYEYVLTDSNFWHAIRVGLTYAVLTVPAGIVLALILAILIKAVGGRLSGALKTIIYLPAMLSSVIAAVVFGFMYQDSGVVNAFLEIFHKDPVAWLNDAGVVLPAIAVPGIWIGLGLTTLILVSALLDIPESYYEAASIEGANLWQKTIYITIPLLRNTFLYLIVTGFTLTIQEFQLPLIMTQGGPVDASTTPNLFIFNSFRDTTTYATSFSLAAALLLFIVLGTISVIVFRLLRSEKAVDA